MIKLFILFSLYLAQSQIAVETEYGEPYIIDHDCILVLVDGHSCALCTGGTLAFINERFPTLERYLIIEDFHPRNSRATQIVRYAGFMKALEPKMVLYPKPGPQFKTNWHSEHTPTPLVFILQEGELTPLSFNEVSPK